MVNHVYNLVLVLTNYNQSKVKIHTNVLIHVLYQIFIILVVLHQFMVENVQTVWKQVIISKI